MYLDYALTILSTLVSGLSTYDHHKHCRTLDTTNYSTLITPRTTTQLDLPVF